MKKLKDFLKVLKYSSLLLVFMLYVILFGLYIGDVIELEFLIVLAIVHFSSFIICLVQYIALNYFKVSIHLYNPKLNGRNFLGANKKSRDFKNALELFVKENYPDALNKFKEIEELSGLTQSEKGLLCFYIARCYQIMHFFPNARNYYKNAIEFGFNDQAIDVFYARNLSELGEIESAIEKYEAIVKDENHEYHKMVYNEIARVYLHNMKPELALEWHQKSVDLHLDYANAIAGCAIASLMMGDFEKSKEFYKNAILNGADDLENFKIYYQELLDSTKIKQNVKE